VIAVPSGVRVLIATRPVDFRKGMDGLAAVVKEHLRVDPFSGAIFVFRAKRADRGHVGWDGLVPVRQTARARDIPLAED
jgi:transposase